MLFLTQHLSYVTLDNKTSHKGKYNYLKICNLRMQKKSKYWEKSPLKLSKWSSLQCILLIKN